MKRPVRMLNSLALSILALLAQNCCSRPSSLPTNAAATAAPPSNVGASAVNQNPAARQLLVAFQHMPSAETRAAIWKKHGVREIEQLTSQPLFLVEAAEGTDASTLKTLQEAIARETDVRYAEPNMQLRTFKSGG